MTGLAHSSAFSRLPVTTAHGLLKSWVWVIAALPLGGCGGTSDSMPALGTLERDRLELVAEAHEPILEIAVREGTHVTAGETLLKLDSSGLSAQLQSARAQVSSARNRLAELVNGPRAESILEARARLEGAQSQLESDTREYQRLRGLVTRQLISQSTLDQQRAQRDNSAAARKQALAQLTLLLKGTRIEELDQARAALQDAEARLRPVEISAERLELKAPRSGIIEALPYKLGERPAAGAVVIVMLADGVPYARVYVPEVLRAQVKAGTAARIHVDGQQQAYSGRLRFISAEAAFTPYFALTQKDRGRLSYLAQVDLLDAAADKLPTGIPVEVRFETAAAAAP